MLVQTMYHEHAWNKISSGLFCSEILYHVYTSQSAPGTTNNGLHSDCQLTKHRFHFAKYNVFDKQYIGPTYHNMLVFDSFRYRNSGEQCIRTP